MYYANYHTHTSHCDGRNTVDEMVQSAIKAGMDGLGFSGHGTCIYDKGFCMSEESTLLYIEDVEKAKIQYQEDIDIYLGVEYEMEGERPTFQRDYTIGSAHSVKTGIVYSSVDNSRAIQKAMVRDWFGGDYYALCEAYYRQVARVQQVTQCDFIGHFDLVTKFNEGETLFQESHKRYKKAALETVEHLCGQGSTFEINTGAMSRGHRTAPYPNPFILKAIRKFGGNILISTDSHDINTVAYGYHEAIQLAKSCGFTSRRVLTKKGWQDVGL